METSSQGLNGLAGNTLTGGSVVEGGDGDASCEQLTTNSPAAKARARPPMPVTGPSNTRVELRGLRQPLPSQTSSAPTLRPTARPTLSRVDTPRPSLQLSAGLSGGEPPLQGRLALGRPTTSQEVTDGDVLVEAWPMDTVTSPNEAPL